MVVRGIVARRDAVEMLTVEFEPVEAPFADDLADDSAEIIDRRLVGRAHGKGAPPAHILRRAVRIENEHVGMVAQQRRAGIDRQRREPQARAHAVGLDAVGKGFHVDVAARKRVRSTSQLPSAICQPSSMTAHSRTEVLRLGQGAVDLLGRAFAFTARHAHQIGP